MSEFIVDAPRSVPGKKGLIRTFTGKYVNPLALTLDDICIEDIAHHLSNECRYIGACPYHYSVAQHSVYVSRQFYAPDWQLVGLLHDASEAYLKDLPSPVKHDPRMAFYRAIEDQVSRLVFAKFGLDFGMIHDVKDADDATFDDEVACFWGEDNGIVSPWMPKRAEKVFLNTFRRIQSERFA